MASKQADEYSAAETERRLDHALKRSVQMKSVPHDPAGKVRKRRAHLKSASVKKPVPSA